jgi:cyanophycinase
MYSALLHRLLGALMRISGVGCALLSLSCVAACLGGEADGGFPWVDPEGVSGAVLFAGGELTEAAREKFKAFASGKEARMVVVSSERGGSDAVLASAAELPGAIVAGGFLDQQNRERLIAAVGKQPDHVGFCVERGAGLAIQGRRLEVLGEGAVTVMLAAGAGRQLREIEVKSGSVHDWTMLRRAAIERSLANFPPQVVLSPVVEHGSLLIHGGGEMPAEVGRRFLELAGGADAPIVVLPIAGEGTLPEDTSRDTRVLTRAGATNVTSLRARGKSEVESAEFALALKEAKGVWFNGGRQWRFVDAYMGTRAEELFRDLLRRGGVIGGSSAGASIQSQYMPRGSPLGNLDMMAEGYERGLGFLPGAAVDQHFTQRKRQRDMTELVRRYPQILGIGLDEGTAIVVQGSMASVMGRGKVHFYDYRCGAPGGERDYTLVGAGQAYDLKARRLVELTP